MILPYSDFMLYSYYNKLWSWGGCNNFISVFLLDDGKSVIFIRLGGKYVWLLG